MENGTSGKQVAADQTGEPSTSQIAQTPADRLIAELKEQKKEAEDRAEAALKKRDEEFADKIKWMKDFQNCKSSAGTIEAKLKNDLVDMEKKVIDCEAAKAEEIAKHIGELQESRKSINAHIKAQERTVAEETKMRNERDSCKRKLTDTIEEHEREMKGKDEEIEQLKNERNELVRSNKSQQKLLDKARLYSEATHRRHAKSEQDYKKLMQLFGSSDTNEGIDEGPSSVEEVELSDGELPDQDVPPCDEVLTSYGEYRLLFSDMHAICANEMVNDAFIDYYLAMIVDEKEMGIREKTFVFSSLFYMALTKQMDPRAIADGDEAAIARVQTVERNHLAASKQFAKDVDLFEKTYVVIPVVEDGHMYLILIVNPGKCIVEATEKRTTRKEAKKDSESFVVIMDSLYDAKDMKRKIAFEIILNYLEMEYFEVWKENNKEKETSFNRSAMELIRPQELPQQSNKSFDCGIFLVKYAEMFFAKPPAENKLKRGSHWKEWCDGIEKSGAKIRDQVERKILGRTDEGTWKRFKEFSEKAIREKTEKDESMRNGRRKSTSRKNLNQIPDVVTIDEDSAPKEKKTEEQKPQSDARSWLKLPAAPVADQPGPSAAGVAAIPAAAAVANADQLRQFTQQDVCTWIRNITDSDEIARKFLRENINGKKLLGFNYNDLVDRLDLDVANKVKEELDRIRAAPAAPSDPCGEPPAKSRRVEAAAAAPGAAVLQQMAADVVGSVPASAAAAGAMNLAAFKALSVEQLRSWIEQTTGDREVAARIAKAKITGDSLFQLNQKVLTEKYGLSDAMAEKVCAAVKTME